VSQLGHCCGLPNSKGITLVEWEIVKEEEKDVEPKEELEEDALENQEECIAQSNEGEMLF